MIQPKFTARGLSKYFAKQEAKLDRIIIRELQLLGEKCVNLCRDLDTYQDDTGNLRSSIAYELRVNDQHYTENFEARPGKGSETGDIGVNNAKAVLSLLNETISGISYELIIVAGMDYAEEVEARDYAVLTPAQHLAESEIPKIKQRIIRALNRAA